MFLSFFSHFAYNHFKTSCSLLQLVWRFQLCLCDCPLNCCYNYYIYIIYEDISTGDPVEYNSGTLWTESALKDICRELYFCKIKCLLCTLWILDTLIMLSKNALVGAFTMFNLFPQNQNKLVNFKWVHSWLVSINQSYIYWSFIHSTSQPPFVSQLCLPIQS